MTTCSQGIHAFLRAYFHMKSGDWKGNEPRPLKGWVASELAKLPVYYVMDIDKDMPQTVAPAKPSDDEIASCEWLPESDLRVYSEQFRRTGFQGGLQVYRVILDVAMADEMKAFSGRTVDVPACFISGDRDWGNHQVPLALSRMQAEICTQMRAPQFISGAGHWVPQEAADDVVKLLLDFVGAACRSSLSKPNS